MSLVDKMLDMSPVTLFSGVAVVCVGLIGTAVYLDGQIQEEFEVHQCVKTQEIRVASSLETGISSNGSVVLVSGQKIEFKYNCNDYPRWK